MEILFYLDLMFRLDRKYTVNITNIYSVFIYKFKLAIFNTKKKYIGVKKSDT